jgi:hypothetical protein
MAKINWKNSSGGDFANASNWSTDTVPGAAAKHAIRTTDSPAICDVMLTQRGAKVP